MEFANKLFFPLLLLITIGVISILPLLFSSADSITLSWYYISKLVLLLSTPDPFLLSSHPGTLSQPYTLSLKPVDPAYPQNLLQSLSSLKQVNTPIQAVLHPANCTPETSVRDQMMSSLLLGSLWEAGELN